MNEAMPRWRTFSSAASSQPPEDHDETATAATRSPARAALPLVLGLLGGAAAGAALVMVAVVLLGSMPSSGPSGSLSSIDALAPLDGDGLMDVTGPDAAMSVSSASTEIVVDVAGAVRHPGLHRLRVGDRVGDAIAAAGGFGPRADLAEADRSLNLAQPLGDGMKVLVPELGVAGRSQTAADDSRIDLNTADQAALESLPGIGPVTAGKIMEARSQQRFASVADLLARGVVGEAVFEDIEDMVRASG